MFEIKPSTIRYAINTINIALRVADAPGQKIGGPDSAVKILRGIYAGLDADQEHFTILALNQKNKITGFKTISSGCMNETVVDMKIVFRTALLMGATKIIAAHNHPSGDSSPSHNDIRITENLVQAGKLLGLDVLDHVILGNQSFYCSMASAWQIQRDFASHPTPTAEQISA